MEEYLKIIYQELMYIKFEFELLKRIDMSIEMNKKSIENVKITTFFMVDSLWYTIIMRIAKVWDPKDKDSHSLSKIFNKISSETEMEELREKLVKKDLSIKKMRENIKETMEDIDGEGETNNLFMEVRNNYYGHLGDFNSPQEAQKKYLITRNRIEKVLNIFFNIVETLCLNLKIDLSFKDNMNKKLAILTEIEYPYIIKSLKL